MCVYLCYEISAFSAFGLLLTRFVLLEHSESSSKDKSYEILFSFPYLYQNILLDFMEITEALKIDDDNKTSIWNTINSIKELNFPILFVSTIASFDKFKSKEKELARHFKNYEVQRGLTKEKIEALGKVSDSPKSKRKNEGAQKDLASNIISLGEKLLLIYYSWIEYFEKIYTDLHSEMNYWGLFFSKLKNFFIYV